MDVKVYHSKVQKNATTFGYEKEMIHKPTSLIIFAQNQLTSCYRKSVHNPTFTAN